MALEVEIEKKFRRFALALSFQAGHDTLAVLGASGAGKTMTLRCIAGLEAPAQGRIVLNDRVLLDSARGINIPTRQRRIGLVFQNYALFPHMTVEQNIGFGIEHMSPAARAARVREQIARMQLRGLDGHYPHELSGGQQQRVALARALIIDPEALLLDEPFSALDTHLRGQLEKQMAETLAAYRGVTLFVTHNIEEAYRLGKNLLVLDEGKAVACGPKQGIFDHPPSLAVARLTGCKNFSRVRPVSPAVLEALDWGCRLRVAQSIDRPVAHVGIRAHLIGFPADLAGENTFPCWLVRTSETPFRITLYLRLNAPPEGSGEHHLQAEVFKEKWQTFKDRPFPWPVQLHPDRLFVLPE